MSASYPSDLSSASARRAASLELALTVRRMGTESHRARPPTDAEASSVSAPVGVGRYRSASCPSSRGVAESRDPLLRVVTMTMTGARARCRRRQSTRRPLRGRWLLPHDAAFDGCEGPADGRARASRWTSATKVGWSSMTSLWCSSCAVPAWPWCHEARARQLLTVGWFAGAASRARRRTFG
jgi:hypothetical protein